MKNNVKSEMSGISIFILGLLFLFVALLTAVNGLFFLGAVMVPISFQIIELGWKKLKNNPVM
ncbi:MAG: hypothetical protein ACWGHO_05100 [Candidatus Moraniibacteriota bacterium]